MLLRNRRWMSAIARHQLGYSYPSFLQIRLSPLTFQSSTFSPGGLGNRWESCMASCPVQVSSPAQLAGTPTFSIPHRHQQYLFQEYRLKARFQTHLLILFRRYKVLRTGDDL